MQIYQKILTAILRYTQIAKNRKKYNKIKHINILFYI